MYRFIRLSGSPHLVIITLWCLSGSSSHLPEKHGTKTLLISLHNKDDQFQLTLISHGWL
jgi:hypothetical protein